MTGPSALPAAVTVLCRLTAFGKQVLADKIGYEGAACRIVDGVYEPIPKGQQVQPEFGGRSSEHKHPSAPAWTTASAWVAASSRYRFTRSASAPVHGPSASRGPNIATTSHPSAAP
jgi:hypothetical protein